MTKMIMIVDDEPDTVDLVKLVLETEGYEILVAYSGSEALEKIKTEKPDMVLLDIMMPGMDGWAVRTKLLEDKETKDIPIVMLTARAQPIDKMIGLHVVGVADYITKPFGRRELVDRVRAVLGE
ncbi:MAG: response regulator [Methanosarcinaceae archaeon]|nr:response regulator [ANME-2 cluster archaeon]NOR46475.1 response regulator [Methanosarcinaceae archaeon]